MLKRCVIVNEYEGRLRNLAAEMRRQGIEITVLDCLSWKQCFMNVGQFIRAARAADFTMISMNPPWEIAWYFVFRLLVRKRWVIDCPVDITQPPFAQSFSVQKMRSFLASSADLFVTMKSRAYLIDKFRLDAKKVFFFENCPDAEAVERASQLPPAYRFPDKTFKLCYTGVAFWQGADKFWSVFRKLHAMDASCFWLLVTNLGEPHMALLEKKMRNSNLERAFHFQPVIKPYADFIATLNHCDLWISSLDNESLLGRHELRTGLLEAGVLGKPAVAVLTPALEQHGFKDGENIIFVEPDDAAGSAEKIAGYMKAPERLAAIGRRLREHVLKHFSIAEQAAALLARIDKINA